MAFQIGQRVIVNMAGLNHGGASGQRAFVGGLVVAIEPEGITVDFHDSVGGVSRTKVTEDRLFEPLAPG